MTGPEALDDILSSHGGTKADQARAEVRRLRVEVERWKQTAGEAACLEAGEGESGSRSGGIP